MWVLGYMGFFRQWSISFSMASVIDLLGRHCEDCPLESGDLRLIPPKKLISLPYVGTPILSPSTFAYVIENKVDDLESSRSIKTLDVWYTLTCPLISFQ